MKRTIAVLAVFSAALICATPAFASHIEAATLNVDAIHLGGGLVQYTLSINNPAGGVIAVEVRVTGNINQIDTDGVIINASPPAGEVVLLPPGEVNRIVEADIADGLDPVYLAAGGSTHDSWWDDTDLSTDNPPFGGVQGGAVGSMQYDFSAGSPALTDVLATGLAQIVIDGGASAAAFIAGLGITDGDPLPVGPAGEAVLSLIDARPLDNSPSLIASQGENFSINGTFALVPEPSTLALLGTGVLGLLAYRWRRRRRA